MSGGGEGRVFCIHPRLAGLTSHHVNEAIALRAELERRGRALTLLVSTAAPPDLAAALEARPVVDDPTFAAGLSFEERTGRFVALLGEHLVGVGRDDVVLITVATQVETLALVQWLRSRADADAPWVVAVFLSDRWNRVGADRARLLAELDELRAALAALEEVRARRFVLAAVTDDLAAELRSLLQTDVTVAPMPLGYDGAAAVERPTADVPRVGVLGGLRREKGSHLLPDIARALRRRGVDASLVVHAVNNDLDDRDHRRVLRLRRKRGVEVIERPLERPAYLGLVEWCDLALLPYEMVPYRNRSSGVFAEAVAAGKPVIATAGTWMAAQIRDGRASGLVIDVLDPTVVAETVARALADLDALTARAAAVRDEWRRTVSTSAFLDVLDRTIEQRRRLAP